ncbi:MAG: M48 family metalloprotease [Spirochaetes bacterium]|nr:M48 family metalloprotease [Spirochaetota bacterium]
MKKINIILFFLILTVFLSCKSTDQTKENPPQAGENDKIRSLKLEEEYLLGKAIATELIHQYGLVNNQQITDYLSAIGHTLATASDRPATYHGYTFGLLDSPDPLAYALPDGYIFLSKGLFQQLDNEDQLAAVLALEIARIVFNDPIRYLQDETIEKANQAFKTSIEQDGRKKPDYKKLTKAFSEIITEMTTLLNHGYPETSHQQIDHQTLQMLSAAGYSSQAIIDLLNKNIIDYQPIRGSLNERKKHLQSNLTSFRSHEIPIERTKRFLNMKNRLN